MWVGVQNVIDGLTDQKRKGRLRCNVKLTRRSQKSVNNARDRRGKLRDGVRKRNVAKRPDPKLTSPATGLNFAKDEAYDTDWGISMEAIVSPASTSPPSLNVSKQVRS